MSCIGRTREPVCKAGITKAERFAVETHLFRDLPICSPWTFREPQSKHHLYCGQEKPAHYHGSLFLRLGTHQIQNRTRDAHKISPHGTMTKRTPAMNWDHAVSWGGGPG